MLIDYLAVTPMDQPPGEVVARCRILTLEIKEREESIVEERRAIG